MLWPPRVLPRAERKLRNNISDSLPIRLYSIKQTRITHATKRLADALVVIICARCRHSQNVLEGLDAVEQHPQKLDEQHDGEEADEHQSNRIEVEAVVGDDNSLK